MLRPATARVLHQQLGCICTAGSPAWIVAFPGVSSGTLSTQHHSHVQQLPSRDIEQHALRVLSKYQRTGPVDSRPSWPATRRLDAHASVVRMPGVRRVPLHGRRCVARLSVCEAAPSVFSGNEYLTSASSVLVPLPLNLTWLVATTRQRRSRHAGAEQ
jgi:hypothetical protein